MRHGSPMMGHGFEPTPSASSRNFVSVVDALTDWTIRPFHFHQLPYQNWRGPKFQGVGYKNISRPFLFLKLKLFIPSFYFLKEFKNCVKGNILNDVIDFCKNAIHGNFIFLLRLLGICVSSWVCVILYLSVCICVSECVCVCVSVCESVCSSVCMCVCGWFLYICVWVFLTACLSVSLSVSPTLFCIIKPNEGRINFSYIDRKLSWEVWKRYLYIYLIAFPE